MTRSEALVLRLCRKSFLSLWSIASPRGKEAGKELCDVLVVCDPDVVIISVKEVEYQETEDVTTGLDRWTSRAVRGSIKQIYGAERLLRRVDRVLMSDGSEWLALPPLERRRVHRIAVALGSKGEVPITDGDGGKGFVHVLDEAGLTALLSELDTITDFTEYLRRTEAFLEDGQMVVMGLENVLGLYLQGGRRFPEDADLLVVQDDIWQGLSEQEDFQRRKAAERISYVWDRMIEHIAREHDPDLTTTVGPEDDPNPPLERVVRIMARENRFARRLLAEAFHEFHVKGGVRSRFAKSPSGVVYVFLARPKGWDRHARANELLARMFVARGLNQDAHLVVGIATEEYEEGGGLTLDVASLNKAEWTDDDQQQMEEIQQETGAFRSPDISSRHVLEYPPDGHGA